MPKSIYSSSGELFSLFSNSCGSGSDILPEDKLHHGKCRIQCLWSFICDWGLESGYLCCCCTDCKNVLLICLSQVFQFYGTAILNLWSISFKVAPENWENLRTVYDFYNFFICSQFCPSIFLYSQLVALGNPTHVIVWRWLCQQPCREYTVYDLWGKKRYV